MSQENVQIVLQQIDAFNRRDVPGVVAFASREVEWEDSMFWTEQVRTFRGRAELRAWVEKVLEPWESIRVEADELAETSDGRVFARLFLTGRGKASGAVTEQDAWTVLWFANGLCTRRRVFRDRDEALEAAGLLEWEELRFGLPLTRVVLAADDAITAASHREDPALAA